MPSVRLPGGKIIFLPRNCGDHEIDLSQYPEIDSTISQEDLVVVGAWSDFSGSGNTPGCKAGMQGIENESFGDLDLKIAKQKDYLRTDRGARASTHRQRSKIITVDVK